MKSIRQCVPEVQENTCRAIEKALEINFSYRTQTMEEFLKDLEMGDGYAIPEVAGKLQSGVSGAIESMTGFAVKAVNVHVGGVSFQ